MTRLPVLIVLAAVACGSEAKREVWRPPTAPAKTKLTLCMSPDPPRRVAQNVANVAAAFRRFTYTGYRSDTAKPEIEVTSREDCPEEVVGTCVGTGGQAYCDGVALVRLQTAVAFQASAWSLINTPDLLQQEKVLGFYSPLTYREALVLAEYLLLEEESLVPLAVAIKLSQIPEFEPDACAGEPHKALYSLAGRLLRFDGGNAPFPRASEACRSQHGLEADPYVLMAYEIYEASSNLLFAYILGHEFAHAHGTCAISTESQLEQTAALEAVARGQMDGTGVHLDVAELRAEACGLRVLDEMHRKMRNWKGQRYPASWWRTWMAVAGGLAEESTATLLTCGLRAPLQRDLEEDVEDLFAGEPPSPESCHRTARGYLLPVYRALLFAFAIRLADSQADRDACRLAAIIGASDGEAVAALSGYEELLPDDFLVPAATPEARCQHVDIRLGDPVFGRNPTRRLPPH